MEKENLNLDPALAAFLSATGDADPLAKDDQGAYSLQDEIAYKANMERKAATHSAKLYKFVIAEPSDASPLTGYTDSVKPKTKADQIRLDMFKNDFAVYKKELEDALFTVTQFQAVQRKILAEILNCPSSVIPLKIEAAHSVLGQTLEKLAAKFWSSYSCPQAANANLFSLLDLQILRSNAPISFNEQIKRITSADRCLDCLSDRRTIGFHPTDLQRRIMNAVDDGNSIIIKSPASTGKTMVSLYLCTVHKSRGKKTIYCGPSKTVCNEFALFVNNQGLKFAIGTEDYFNRSEMENPTLEVLICTPVLLAKLLCYARCEDSFLDSIGACIIDEAPTCFDAFPRQMPVISMLGAGANWQLMVMSATMPDDLVSVFQSMYERRADGSSPALESSTSESTPETPSKNATPTKREPTKKSTSTAPKNGKKNGTKNGRKHVPNNTNGSAPIAGPRRLVVLEPNDIAVRPTDLKIYCVTTDRMDIECVPTCCTYPVNSLAPSRYLRVPVTQEEFLASKYSANDVNRAIPYQERLTVASDFTHTARQFQPSVLAQYPDPIVQGQPTPQQILDLMDKLNAKNMLPALFVSNDHDILETYHQKVADLLQERYEPLIKKVTLENKQREKELSKLSNIEREKVERDGGARVFNPEFGMMETAEMAAIFKHRSDGKGNIKLGYRGRQVANSQYAPGLALGLGLHHHGIPTNVRDAVESGLRLGLLKVVFSGFNFAIGINMPVKTVIFIDGGDPMTPSDFVQAAGRAGRWGMDKEGAIIFLNHQSATVSSIVWGDITSRNPISRMSPFGDMTALMLSSGNFDARKTLIEKCLKLHIPLWNWVPEALALPGADGEARSNQDLFKMHLMLLKTVGLLDQSMRITYNGELTLALIDEGEKSYYVGMLFHRHAKALRQAIQSKADFLYFATFLVHDWRMSSQLFNGPTLADIQDSISGELVTLLRHFSDYCRLTLRAATEVMHAPNATALYVKYPHLTEFDYFANDVASAVHHFWTRMKFFQSYAQLPFGDEALAHLHLATGCTRCSK